MKKTITGFIILMLWGGLVLNAQETFKVMFYNLLNYPDENQFPDRDNDLDLILNDYLPDLFLVCELNNETGANTILDIIRAAVSTDYEMATYVPNTSDDSGSDENLLQNLLYYNSSKFILEEEIIVPTDLRDFNVYKVKLNTVDQNTNPIEVYIVVAHLKASQGPSNELRRFEMVQELDAYLNTLPSNTNVLLGGDLNLYTAFESAFQELLDTSNNITFSDPVNRVGSWSSNSSFVDVFTQSTRTQGGLGGASGGFDDRFDFILTSENMLSTSNLKYVPDSYQVYGNNEVSSCFNSRINSLDCAGPQYSLEIRNALHNFSDHLPVTISLEANATLNIDDTFVSGELKLEKTVVSSYITLISNSIKLSNEKLIVYNSLGQIVKSDIISPTLKQNIDVSDLSNGVYYLVLSNQLKINPLKFIIGN